ncbi:MAG: hypothetical protein JW703_00230 [Candidatus Diapherotrites archaeon]|nr:hypothetical protein [Candidatus Diapherotrites archaeon]
MNKKIGIILILLIFILGCTQEPTGEAKGLPFSLFSTTSNTASMMKVEETQKTQAELIQEKTVYSEGEWERGLNGMPVKIKVMQVAQSGTTSVSYQATIGLYTENEELIDSKTMNSLGRLEQTFVDSEGNYTLTTPIVVTQIGVNPSTGIGFVKLEKNKWYENQNMINLWGKNSFEGQKLKIHVNSVMQYGTTPSSYRATLSLYNETGTLIDVQTVNPNTNLSQEFTDSEGNYVLGTQVYLNTISVETTNGIGYIKATIN